MDSRRSFFDEFARSHAFDPSDVEKWYSFTATDVLQTQVSPHSSLPTNHTPLLAFPASLFVFLLLFSPLPFLPSFFLLPSFAFPPNLHLRAAFPNSDETFTLYAGRIYRHGPLQRFPRKGSFRSLPESRLAGAELQSRAKYVDFPPLSSLSPLPSASLPPFAPLPPFPLLCLLRYHATNLILYSIIGNFWSDRANRRRFFDEYAVANGFDSRSVKNWYQIRKEDVLKFKVIIRIQYLVFITYVCS